MAGRPKKIITKEQILAAQARTKSNKAASRYLHVSYNHYKKYAKMYKDEESGKSLFELHLNQAGKGIPKFTGEESPLEDIIEGRVPSKYVDRKRLKERIISEGLLEEKCHHCGFTEQRLVDARAPLILHFKDGDKINFRLDNLGLLCYNCYFLYVGDIFSGRELHAMENYQEEPTKVEPDWELDEYMIEHLRDLNLYEDAAPSGSEFIAYRV